MNDPILYLGIKGNVVAVKKADGKEIWRTNLKGSEPVTLAVEDDWIYALNCGRLYCLDKHSGKVLWKNGLKGLGYDLGMVSVGEGSSDGAAMAQMNQAQQAAAAAAAAVVGSN